MARSGRQESKSTGSQTWIARDAKSGRFVEIKSAKGSAVAEGQAAKRKAVPDRRPGRFKGVLSVGPEFFEPLSEKDLEELNGA
ncbi:hypothetical protein IHQ71_10215 [Rhizobium sp. TH2]|uniref:hypothetical protein n=1 Tax=Rhizobium sp. TH2 TaxID=2775403 RepID=UPI002157CAF6|nr:hypothetical protein [Rhizobium sp. TH2]UVC10915.1 hypothetical protein IHQ71_10215 [Rhizobium sp. TH2]